MKHNCSTFDVGYTLILFAVIGFKLLYTGEWRQFHHPCKKSSMGSNNLPKRLNLGRIPGMIFERQKRLHCADDVCGFPHHFLFRSQVHSEPREYFSLFKLALFSLIKWWMYWVETKLDYLNFHCILRPISPRLCAVRVYVVPQKVQQRIPDLFTKNESRLFFQFIFSFFLRHHMMHLLGEIIPIILDSGPFPI